MQDESLEACQDIVADMLKASSWAEGVDLDHFSRGFLKRENRKAFQPLFEARNSFSRNLLLSSKQALSDWSSEMLAHQKRITERGFWQEVTELSSGIRWTPNIMLRGDNAATKIYEYLSTIDISGTVFDDEIELGSSTDDSRLEFPGNFIAIGCQFNQPVRMSRWQNFGGVSFRKSIFKSAWGIQLVDCDRIVDFSKCVFEKEGGISGTFKGNVWLESAVFHDRVYLGIHSSGDVIGFSQATFKEWTSLDCMFECRVEFSGVAVERSFHLNESYFRYTPDFRQTNFKEAPDFGSASLISSALPEGEAQRDRHRNALPSLYRSLRKLAGAANDHARELDFLAAEIKARRGVEDFLLPRFRNAVMRQEVEKRYGFLARSEVSFWRANRRATRSPIFHGTSRYLFGWIYQLTSDFGRSAGRSVFGLLVTWLLFSFIYTHLHLSSNAGPIGALRFDETAEYILGELRMQPMLQVSVDGCSPVVSALEVSFGQSALLPNLTGLLRDSSGYRCVFGERTVQGKPVIDYSVLELLFLFLNSIVAIVFYSSFILVVRNYFRLK